MQPAKNKWLITPLILLTLVVVLHLIALQPAWIEKFYSAYLYAVISSLLRILTRWIPFSIGDILYALSCVWFIVRSIQFFRRKPTWKKFLFACRNFLVKFLWIYLIFLLFWGLNYYRFGIGYEMKLYPAAYSTADLRTVTAKLRDELNSNRRLIDSLHIHYADETTTAAEAVELYDSAKNNYPFLRYNYHDVKKMLVSEIGNFSGFLGYYNPFTGEAQVNTKVPACTIPFTTCHEIGHQLGFASESEASFAGYLVIKSGNSPVFNYSAYFELFGFANGELFVRDSAAARQNIKLLDTLVKKDYAEYKKYLKDNQNPIEPYFTKLYGNYLKVHNQPKGIESYDEIVAWAIAYYKKYGKV